MPCFERYVGLRYSGTQTAISSLKGLRVYLAEVLLRALIAAMFKTRFALRST